MCTLSIKLPQYICRRKKTTTTKLSSKSIMIFFSSLLPSPLSFFSNLFSCSLAWVQQLHIQSAHSQITEFALGRVKWGWFVMKGLRRYWQGSSVCLSSFTFIRIWLGTEKREREVTHKTNCRFWCTCFYWLEMVEMLAFYRNYVFRFQTRQYGTTSSFQSK